LQYFPRIEEIADRVVWGTDWPSPGVKDLRQNLDQFLALPLPNDVKDKITRTNPLSLIPNR
ncbi:MAG: amidohydrolase family protein, partial [Gemmatimonadetes bacterium]|nr:amidohydrolase family protein [Gemmatimonadota bacterium]